MKRAGGADRIKREQLVDIALKLICRCGHWATTVEDICALASASTGSAFHYFSNKEELPLDSLATGVMEQLRNVASASPTAGAEGLIALCDALIQFANAESAANGCRLVTISMRTNINAGAVVKRCPRCFDVWCAVLERQIAYAIAEDGRLVATAAQLAQFCVSRIEGASILVRARQDVTIVENALHRFKWYVGDLLGLLASAQFGISASQRSAIQM